MKKLNLKKLAKTVSAMMAMSCVSTLPMIVLPTQVQASDIEIYQAPQQGQKTIMLMLDTSGSMGLCDVSLRIDGLYNEKWHQVSHSYGNIYTEPLWHANAYWNISVPDNLKKINQDKIRQYIGSERDSENMYTRHFCYAQKNGQPDFTDKRYNRITKLKDAIFTLMNDSSIDETIVMGVGVFAAGTKGSILVPARPLTAEHKALIKQIVARNVGASGGTPSATAYTEAAAYLMGTTTALTQPYKTGNYKKEWYAQPMVNGKPQFTNPTAWQKCTAYAVDGLTCTNNSGEAVWEFYDSSNTRQKQAPFQGILRKNSADMWFNFRPQLPSYKVEQCRTLAGTCLVEVNDYGSDVYLNNDAYNKRYSGIENSVNTSKANGKYNSPLPTTGKECSGQAIYFLTDGYPNNVDQSQYVMHAALASQAGDFPLDAKTYLDKTKYLDSNNGEGMAPAGELAKRLRDKDKNPAGVSISTAVVGFGADFTEAKKNTRELEVTDANGKRKIRKFYDCSKITRREIRNACNWGEKSHAQLPGVGGYGEGGFFYAEDSQDIVKSLQDVIADIPNVTPDVKTGAPSIPVEPLTRQSYINAAYYAEFSPRPDQLYQLWTGKMGKYNLSNGTIVGKNDEALYATDGDINRNAKALWDSLAQLELKKNSKDETARVVYTNRTVNNATATSSNNLAKVTVSELLTGAFATDPNKNYWLNFLGYLVGTADTIQNESDLTNKSELRQLGAVMHSTPIMLTQKGTVTESGYRLSIADREDYLLYGSTQGALHVVDEKTGREKFAFVPHEMMESQKEALLHQEQTSGGKNALYYGIDAPWTAHTQYAINSSGVSTVKSPDANQKAHQWVYGGLRMGGRSYYALDLTDMNAPKMKFHIDPVTGNIYNKNQTVKNYPQIKTMGQSWSKPVLGYVNWRVGNTVVRKLVMFVGGGYDAGGSEGNGEFSNGIRTYKGYEQTNYVQSNKRGAGVFMFDADTGDLLWWASSNHNGLDTQGVKYLAMPDMKYSVVSRINTVDRNSDGLIDNLYFGDLSGQAFRIDLNNNATSNDSFAVRGVRLFNEHKTDGTSPRFYDMPSVAVFLNEKGKRFVTASFVSGDMSSPLAGTERNVLNQQVVTATAQDGVFVVYDNDIGSSDLYESTFTSGFATDGSLVENDLTVGVPHTNDLGQYNRGWKYIYPANATIAGVKKGTGEPYTFINFLFANIYNKDGQNNTSGQCGAGIRGNTTLEQFCMPTGKCLQDVHGFANSSNTPSSSVIGAGNVRATVAGMGDGFVGNTSGKDKGGPTYCDTNPQDPLCQKGRTPPKVQQLRWYETH